jgi:hypothetical protein
MGYTDNAETAGIEKQGGESQGAWISAKNVGIARSLAEWSGRSFEECAAVMAGAPPAMGPDARPHEPLRRFIEEHRGAVTIRKHYDRWLLLRRRVHAQDLALDPLLNE